MSGSSTSSKQSNKRESLSTVEESPMKPLAPEIPPPPYNEVITSQKDVRTAASANTLVRIHFNTLLWKRIIF